MKRSIFIASCLIILTACTAQQPSDPGRIYFGRDRAVWALNVADSQKFLLLDHLPTERMSVSPDGQWLVYPVLSDISQPYSPRSLWVVDARTGQESEIIHKVSFFQTAWLPDSRLLVVEYPDWQVFSDGTGIKGIAHHTTFDLRTGESDSATWYVSPPEHGGVQYAPTFDCAAKALLDLDRQGPDILQVLCEGTSDPITIATPLSLGDVVWSADGQFLAFRAREETTLDSWRLYVWYRETGLKELVNTGTKSVTALSWSPDSQWLAFENGPSLCVLRLADQSATCFDGYLSGMGRPISWSLDSTSLVLSTCATEVCEQFECDCSSPVLVTVSVPDGEITVLATDVDIGFPLWGK